MTLTPAQQRVLDFVQSFIREKGYPPTRKEISASLGFSSGNSAECHLKALARQGVITLAPNISRGIRLNQMEAA